MNIVWGVLIWMGSGIIMISMLGCFGLWNALLRIFGARWWTHLIVWLACIVVFTVGVALMPRTIYFDDNGDMTFSDERAISQIFG